jgi:hypothetical protein
MMKSGICRTENRTITITAAAVLPLLLNSSSITFISSVVPYMGRALKGPLRLDFFAEPGKCG